MCACRARSSIDQQSRASTVLARRAPARHVNVHRASLLVVPRVPPKRYWSNIWISDASSAEIRADGAMAGELMDAGARMPFGALSDPTQCDR
jgi:hypothetical protein